MKGTDAALNDRVRRARGVLREIIDLADIQCWSYRIKDEGLLFYPPKAIERPGFGSVFARDPGNDSGWARQMRDRFRKAGMKFPDDEPQVRTPRVTTSKTAQPAPPTVAATPATDSNPIGRIKRNIGAIVTALSEIEHDLGAVEKDQAAVAVIRDAFKSLG